MANDNNGLYLPLKINLSEWEKSLATADADLQKAMREMRASVKNLKLQYDVKIAGAKAAGNDLKVLELEEQKLNQLYAVQKQAVEALNRAYEKSVRDKGASAKASQALAQQLVRESRELDKIQTQINSKGINIGKSLSDGLASISPEFAKVRQLTANLTSRMSELGGVAVTAGKAVAGIAIPVGVITAGVAGLKRLVDSYKETANASAEANEEVYQLREVLNSSYKEAELLAGAARIDGVNLDALGSSVNMLYKNIDLGNEKGKRAVAILEQYGATITDINGNRKNTIDFFRELQNAFANAEAMGRGRDFLTALFGGSSDQFLHFIKGFDYYISKAEEVQAVNEKEYQLSHDLLDLKKQQAEAERQLASVRGDAFLAGAVEAQKAHNAGLQEQIKLYEDAKEKLAGYSTEMKNLALAEEGASLAWEKFKISLQTEGMKAFDSVWTKTKKVAEAYDELKQKTPAGDIIFGSLERLPGLGFALKQLGLVKDISDSEKQVEEQAQHKAYMDEIEAMEARIAEEDRIKEQSARDKVARAKKEQAENQKVIDKQKEAQEKFYRELQDLRSSDYEKEINALNDRKEAWIKANVDILDVEKRYAEEKALIDKKYYDKQEAERQRNLKQAQEAYRKEAEEAKRAKETQINDAQSTIQNASKLLSYIRKQKDAGTYNEEDVRKYADKLSLKSQGLKQSQIDTAYEIGIDKLKELMDSRTRIFGKFAGITGGGNNLLADTIGFQTGLQAIPQAPQVQPQQVIQPTINISFDGTVVEDMSSMQKIADKVSEVIQPAIEKALRGESTYGY